jgi:glycosyltransferase involved in cell wall biosynthesis
MAAGRPVVAAAAGWTAQVIADAGAGIACPPEQPAALADAIAQVAGDPERARDMGASGRRYVEANLTRRAAADRLDRALRSLVDHGGA